MEVPDRRGNRLFPSSSATHGSYSRRLSFTILAHVSFSKDLPKLRREYDAGIVRFVESNSNITTLLFPSTLACLPLTYSRIRNDGFITGGGIMSSVEIASFSVHALAFENHRKRRKRGRKHIHYVCIFNGVSFFGAGRQTLSIILAPRYLLTFTFSVLS